MPKFNFNCKKTLKCVRCGDCCHIRQSELVKLNDDEDYKIRKKVYENTGVIYLFPLKHYTISLTLDEKKTLEEEAVRLGIKIKVLPKKIVINSNNTKAEVIDYFVDHDVCPFLKNENICMIYESRPQVCRIFPHLFKQDIIDISKLIDKDSDFRHVLKKAKQLIKKN